MKAVELDSAGNITRVEFLTEIDFHRPRQGEDAPGDYPRKTPSAT